MDIKRIFQELTFIILLIYTVQRSLAGDIYDDDEEESGQWDRCPWIRNKLKNGRVKIRSRGRIAKFLCEPGYELAGKRFATCVRGQWNNPLPVCVSRGCHRPPQADNARVTMMYRGAVLAYDCLPGYTMDGGASIYCDGRRWSANPPTCVVSTSDPQTSCDFEDPDLCGWSHDPTHDFDWKRNQFATPSGHVGTGPSFDHTFGEGKAGFYLFMEASAPRAVNDTARLFSPVYHSEYSGGCFIFWYHMFGSTTGGLRVYLKPESHVFGELPPAWVLYGDQGNHWFRGNITLPHISENFQIIIEGIRGSSYIGDTAIDDVSLNDGDCESIGNSTDNTSETFSDSCRGRCRESANSSACGCNDDCVALRSCCYDFESICTKNTETETDESKNENTTDITTVKYTSHSSDTSETEVREETKSRTTAQGTTSQSFSPQTTQLDIETTTVTVKDVSVNISQPIVVFTTPSTEKATSSTTTRSTRTSTIATTTTTTATQSTASRPTTTATQSSTSRPTTTSTQSTTSRPTTTVASTTTSTAITTPLPAITFTPSTTLKVTTSTMAPKTSTTMPTTVILSSTSPSTTISKTTTLLQTTTTEEPSTRRIYILRPRNRTTVSSYTTVASDVTFNPLITPTSPERTSKTSIITLNSQPPLPTTATQSTSTTTFTNLMQRTTRTLSSMVTIASQESTKKFTIEQGIATEKPITESEAHASKTESVSSAGSPVATIVSVIIVILVCAVVGALYFVRRWKAQKLLKGDDDSEMRFLSENEVVEYSDSSALDRINFNS